MTYLEAAGLIELCQLHQLPPPNLHRDGEQFRLHWENADVRFAATDYEAATFFCHALWQERASAAGSVNPKAAGNG